ncbi:MAG: ATP-dependent DNA helicase RecG [Ignavibacteriae bacterium]|nr:ATP-dependent DNA helicase RecG [Ignavibacteriota bacterium]
MQTPSQHTSPLQYLKGVGPKRAKALESIGIHSAHDVLYYFPRDYLDRSRIIPIKDLKRYAGKGEQVTVVGEVFRFEVKYAKKSRRSFFVLTVKDSSGYLQCVWFEGVQWYKDAFEQGELLSLSSYPDFDKLGRVQFIHPEFDRLKGAMEEDEPDWGKMFNTGAIIPKYPSTADLTKVGLDSRGFRRILRNALNSHIHEIKETLSNDIRQSGQLVDLPFAIRNIHFPENTAALETAKRRLKFDELFFLQLMLAFRKRSIKEDTNGISFAVESKLARQLVDSLPFELTTAQRRVVKEISDDMRMPKVMNRLLQGDVGSGKTIVALLAMLIAVENGYQAAFMAPTEVLAEQHFRTLAEFLKNLPVNVRLLIGGQKRKLRQDVLDDIHRGSAQIVVGTHALIQEHVEFGKLGLVVIDEQHRFGVMQRATLRAKGANALPPDVLVMTATPIPRTLAMSLYGDLDVSVIDEMPAHRKPIKTAVRLEDQKAKVFDFVQKEIAQGRQAYIVFPIIEESEKVDLKAATAGYDRLSKIFPDLKLALIHGRMKTEAKDAVMREFKSGAIDILVATTVIEVGIDVPNATIMIIENAERFGLSQLHQLRGRVGRGADQSYCILIADYGWFDHSKGLAEMDVQREKKSAKVRLETMVETTDGFKIAEVDLQLRGPGDFFGTKQSGMPEFRIANIVEDRDLMMLARKEAFDLVVSDPHLRRTENAAIRRHFELRYKEIQSLGEVG